MRSCEILWGSCEDSFPNPFTIQADHSSRTFSQDSGAILAVPLGQDHFHGLIGGTHLRLAVPSSTYLVRISSKLLMSWLKDSRSITKQLTPSGSSAMMLAVRTSSLFHSVNHRVQNLHSIQCSYRMLSEIWQVLPPSAADLKYKMDAYP